MRFPRQTKIFRGQLDVAPFAGVFFLLLLLLLLQSAFVFTPGIPIQLPQSSDLPGTDQPTVFVSVDASGRLFFDNQIIDEPSLKSRLRAQVANARQNLTLILQADGKVSYDKMISISLLAEEAGIRTVLLATRTRSTPLPAAKSDAN